MLGKMEPLVHQARRFVTFHFVSTKDVELLLLLADIQFNSSKLQKQGISTCLFLLVMCFF